jgi:hypothetical protein
LDGDDFEHLRDTSVGGLFNRPPTSRVYAATVGTHAASEDVLTRDVFVELWNGLEIISYCMLSTIHM